MRPQKILNSFLILIIGLALVLALVKAVERYRIEIGSKNLIMAMNWSDLTKLARREGQEPWNVLQRLKNKGLNGLLIREETVDDLKADGTVAVLTGRELLTQLTLVNRRPEWFNRIKPEFNYILATDQAVYERVAENLTLKTLGAASFAAPELGGFLTGTASPREDLTNIGLGFPLEVMEKADEKGLKLLAQMRSWPGARPEDLARVFQPLQKFELAALLFNDNDLPGGTKYIPELAGEVRKLGVPVATVEFFKQQGLATLIRLVDKRALRLHAIPAAQMAKITQAEAIDRFVLATTDRGVRLLYLRPFLTSQKGGTLIHENLVFTGELQQRLRQQGFGFGEVLPAPPGALPFSRVTLGLIGLGVIAGGMLFLNLLGWPRLSLVAGILALLMWAGLILIGQISLARKLMALAAVIVFPTLALTINLPRGQVSAVKAVRLLLHTSLISLIGALLMVGLLADLSFMLKIDEFAGVKASFLLPLLLVALVYLYYQEPERTLPRRLKSFFDHPVLVKYVVLFGILAVIGVIYILRTGNEAAALVSGPELKLRALLDRLLGARPRTKEFLIGHPFLILAYYLGGKQAWKVILFLLGAIGQISIVNTYAHIWSPLGVSLLRTFNGLWLGILIGLGLILLYRLAAGRLGKYLTANE